MVAQTLHSNSAWHKHQESMMASLAHRLEAAKVAGNFSLIQQLEQEKQQIAGAALPDRPHWWQTLWADLTDLLWGGTELKVQEFQNGGDHWWYAIDPNTGRCVYADSEAELRLWIRDNYQGR